MSNIVKIDTELTAIEPSKAKQIKETFEPMIQMLESFEAQCGEIFAEAEKGITPEVSAKAKRTRLDIAKVRISADKARKEMKEEYLRAGNAIQGAYNVLAWAVTDRENRLKEIEEHAERMEVIRLQELQVERANLLRPYADDADERKLSDMDEETFQGLLQLKKKQHEDTIEAERLAEIERQRLAEIERLHKLRLDELIKDGNISFTDVREFGELTDDEFAKIAKDAIAKRKAHEAEQKRIREENERLEAERKKAEKVRLELEAKAKEEREKAEAERRKLQAELQAKIEAEAKAQAEAEAKERARIEAEEAAKSAPDKDKIIATINSLAYSVDVKSKKAKTVSADISAKFESFKAWAIKQAEQI